MTGLMQLALAGMGKQTVYETGVVVTQPIYMVSEGVMAESGPMGSEFKTGRRAEEYLGQLGYVKCGGTLVEQMRYLLSTDPAHLLMEQMFGRSGGHVYRNLTREAWVPLRLAAADNVMLAFSLTPTVTASAGVRVRLRLRRRGALLTGGGNLQVVVDGDAAGDPDETPIANGSSAVVDVGAVTLDDNGQEIEFTFAISPTLTAATPLHCRLIGTFAAHATDNIEMAVETVAAGGNFEVKDAAWANSATQNAVGRILTTTFTDSFLMANSIEGLFATVAFDKQVSVHEYLGMKVQNAAMRSTPADGLRCTYDLVGLDEDQTPTNTAVGVRALKNTRSFPLHHNLTLWVGDHADALQTSDAVKVDSFEARYNRPLDQVFVSGGRGALEPLENAQARVALTLSIPRYAADTFRAFQNAGTPLQVRAQWEYGGKYLTQLFPYAIIEGQVDIKTGAATPYTQNIVLRCFANLGQNGYMAIEDEAELNLLA